MDSLKLTVDENVYRRPVPGNDQGTNGYIPVGETIEIKDIVFGKAIEGNSVWYQSVDGYYCWSGCIQGKRSDFVLPGKIFREVKPEDQHALCTQALQVYGDIWREKYPELTVLSVAKKQENGTGKSYYSIVFHAKVKGPDNGNPFPKVVRFKGFEIPTDVKEAGRPYLCVGPGSDITKPNYSETGTAGFLAEKNGTVYLVSCYHVLCNDLRLSAVKMLFENERPNYNRKVLSKIGSPIIGSIVSGMFTDFTDCVKVRLFDQTVIPPSAITIKGVKFKSELINLPVDQSTVSMLGAVSTGGLKGKIVDVNSDFPVPGSSHKFSGVIKIELVARPGDSGGPVLTSDGMLIGIVAATDGSQYSYVIPIGTILGNLGLSPNNII